MGVIAVNACPAAHARRTGVERYVLELLGALRVVAPSASLRLATHAPIPLVLPEAWRQEILARPRHGWALRWSAHLARTRPDIMVVPGNALPPYTHGRIVTTMHDVAFERAPQLYSLHRRAYLRWTHARAARLADHILTPTETVRREVMEMYGLAEDRVTMTPLGIAHDQFFPRGAEDADVARVRNAYGLDRPYLLFVGRLETKKGVDTLVRAYAAATGGREPSVALVLAGARGASVPQEFDELVRATAGVRTIGFVPDEDLAPLVCGAHAFVTATRKEGFGMPILEAMACGTPVICSDLDVLREVGGDIPTYVSVDDADAWAAALAHTMTHARDAARRARGIAHAQSFTWDRTARLTWRVLQTLHA